MIRTPHIVALLCCLSLVGCATHLADRITWLDKPQGHQSVEAPRDSKLLVVVDGDASQRGPHWVPEGANILAVEEISGAGDEGVITLEPKHGVIRREVDGRI